MFEKEIDEIYELCKRVVNEVPTANASFNYSIYGMSVCGLKRKEDVSLPEDKFKWDLYQNVSFDPFYEKESRESLRIIKTFLKKKFEDLLKAYTKVQKQMIEKEKSNKAVSMLDQWTNFSDCEYDRMKSRCL